MENLFITGITGFIGSNFAEYISKARPEVRIVGLTRDFHSNRRFFIKNKLDEKVDMIVGDMLNYNLMERIVTEYEIDTIVNFASQSIVRVCNDNPLLALYSNVAGSAILQEVARRHNNVRRFIQVSSDKTYGQADVLPYMEDETPLKGLTPYECTKSMIDLWSQMNQYNYDMPITVIRPANVFGPGDHNTSRLVPQSCINISKGRNPWLWEGVADYVREFIYIDDLIDFILNIIYISENESNNEVLNQVYNVGSGNVFKVKDFLQKIIDISGKDVKIEFKKKRMHFKEIPEQYLSLKKAKEMLNWEARYTESLLDEALKMTYNYYANI